MWPLCGLYVDLMWTLCGPYVDAVWALCGRYVGAMCALCAAPHFFVQPRVHVVATFFFFISPYISRFPFYQLFRVFLPTMQT